MNTPITSENLPSQKPSRKEIAQKIKAEKAQLKIERKA